MRLWKLGKAAIVRGSRRKWIFLPFHTFGFLGAFCDEELRDKNRIQTKMREVCREGITCRMYPTPVSFSHLRLLSVSVFIPLNNIIDFIDSEPLSSSQLYRSISMYLYRNLSSWARCVLTVGCIVSGKRDGFSNAFMEMDIAVSSMRPRSLV